MSDAQRIAQLEREVQTLRNGLAQRPLRQRPTTPEPVLLLEIIDGQTVYNSGGITLYGIVKYAGAFTTVPSLYDPNAVGETPGLFTATDGIGRARLYVNGTLQPDLVLVAHDSHVRDVIPFALVNADRAITASTISILVGAGPDTITAYVPVFI